MGNYELIGETHGGSIHAENQDRILMRLLSLDEWPDRVYLIGVADGISQSAYGASVAHWLFERHCSQDVIFVAGPDTLSNQLQTYLHGLHKRFCSTFEDFPEMLASGASLSICAIQGACVECFWVGDCPIFLSELIQGKYRTKQVTTADFDKRTSTLSVCVNPFETLFFRN